MPDFKPFSFRRIIKRTAVITVFAIGVITGGKDVSKDIEWVRQVIYDDRLFWPVFVVELILWQIVIEILGHRQQAKLMDWYHYWMDGPDDEPDEGSDDDDKR